MLQACDLYYRYPGDTAGLQGLSLTVVKGRRLALLGANGAGKTTLLLHLNGILRPQQGEVRLHNAPISYTRDGLRMVRQHIGLVFQNPEDQLFAGTVYQDVSFGPLNLGLSDAEARQRVEEALTALEITDLADRPTHMLSFGQKKRAAIAGAIAMRPCTLILDEPTAGLDPEGAAQLLTTLDRLHAHGATLVIATHDMDLAYAWADDVAILHQGRTLAYGRPDEILRDRTVLQQSRLTMPLILDVAMQLTASGCVAFPGDHLPRTRADLMACLCAGTPT